MCAQARTQLLLEAASRACSSASLTEILQSPNGKLRRRKEKSWAGRGGSPLPPRCRASFVGAGQGGSSHSLSVDTSILVGMFSCGLPRNNVIENTGVLRLEEDGWPTRASELGCCEHSSEGGNGRRNEKRIEVTVILNNKWELVCCSQGMVETKVPRLEPGY